MELPDFIKNLKSKINHKIKKSLSKNLVFKGCGVRGIAYIGALEILDKLSIVDNFESHQSSSYITNRIDKHRTIEINDHGIKAFDFDIEPRNEKYKLLYESGKEAV